MFTREDIMRFGLDSYREGEANGITVCCDAISGVMKKGIPSMMGELKGQLIAAQHDSDKEIEAQLLEHLKD